MRVGRLVGWLVLLWPAAGLAAGPGSRLMEAVRSGDTAVVRALVEQGVDVTTPEGDGATALHWAAYADDVETADLLIRAGAGVDATNDLGVTPLWVAGTNGSAEMVARLLEAGANPNIAPATGGTPLMRAVRTGNADAVEALLTAGADVNASEGSPGAERADVGRDAAPPRGRAVVDRTGRRPRGPHEGVASARSHLLPGEQHRRQRLHLDGAGRVHALALRGPAGRSRRGQAPAGGGSARGRRHSGRHDGAPSWRPTAATAPSPPCCWRTVRTRTPPAPATLLCMLRSCETMRTSSRRSWLTGRIRMPVC